MSEIHDAIMREELDVVIKLLDKDKRLINKQNEDGNTPLHLILKKLEETIDPVKSKAYLDILDKMLQNKELKLNIKNKKNKTCVQLFSRSLYGKTFSDYLPYLKALLNSDKRNIVYLFHDAIYAHNLDVVKHLLQINNELIYEKDERGFSPFQIALAASAVNVEQFFNENYPDVIASETKLDLDFSKPHTAATIIKAAFTYEHKALREDFEKIIDELYDNPEFRPVMDIVAASLVQRRDKGNMPIRIFVANSGQVSDLTPKSSGHGDFDIDANILRIGGARDKKVIKGTIIHEFTHLAALITYANACKPYVKDSKEEQMYKEAINGLVEIYLRQTNFNPLERPLSDLLVSRIEAYRSAEERSKLPSGTLSEPEWLVSIPQAFVLYGMNYIDGQVSLVENHGMPMVQFWRHQFNADVKTAFERHPFRKFVNTHVALKDVDSPKVVLTTEPDAILKFLMSKRYEIRGYDMAEGYDEGHVLQYKIINQILIGDLFDQVMKNCKLPSSLNLADAKALAQHPIFFSPEYKDAYRRIYNALTVIWKEKGSPKEFSLKDLDPSEVKKLRSLVPPEFETQLQKVIGEWGIRIEERYKEAGICVDTILNMLLEDKSYNKKDFTGLRQKLIESLYAHWPTQSPIPRDAVQDVLAQELVQAQIIKSSSTFINKNLYSIKGSEEKISGCVQTCLRVLQERKILQPLKM
jgi:hypothetical protein